MSDPRLDGVWHSALDTLPRGFELVALLYLGPDQPNPWVAHASFEGAMEPNLCDGAGSTPEEAVDSLLEHIRADHST